MSQLERVEEEKKRKGGHKQTSSQSLTTGTYLSFNPTKEEKEILKEMKVDYVEFLDFISTYLQDGYRLTWKFMPAQEAYVWSLSEANSDWRTNRVLTCWHVDFEKALKMLYFALNNRFKGWPDLMPPGAVNDLEW